MSGFDKGAKVSRIENLRQVEKSTGVTPPELAEQPELRPEAIYLWELFVTLKNATPDVIRFVDIEAYSRVYGDLTPFEVDVIRNLENLSRKER